MQNIILMLNNSITFVAFIQKFKRQLFEKQTINYY